MKNKLKIICGVAVFAFALAFNMQYAFDGYGVSNHFFMQAIAESGGSGGSGGGSSGGNDDGNKKETSNDCMKLNAAGKEVKSGYKEKKCEGSGTFCLKVSCPEGTYPKI